MNTQAPAGQGGPVASVQISEIEGWSAPGVQVLVAGIVAMLVTIGLFALGVALKSVAPRRSRTGCRWRSPTG